MVIPTPSWRICEVHCSRCARDLARDNAGKSIPARIAMIAITTSSSINVNPIALVRVSRASLLGFMAFISMRFYRLHPAWHVVKMMDKARGQRALATVDRSGVDSQVPPIQVVSKGARQFQVHFTGLPQSQRQLHCPWSSGVSSRRRNTRENPWSPSDPFKTQDAYRARVRRRPDHPSPPDPL